MDEVARSDCASYPWQQRGRAPLGFVKGVALTYSKAYCSLKRDRDSAEPFVAGDVRNSNRDALRLYTLSPPTPTDRLRATYVLALGEGMRESHGNPTEGYDVKAKMLTPESAEAGLFQVSYDSLPSSAWLATLYNQYRSGPADCMHEVYMDGVDAKHVGEIGTGKPAVFQKFTKSCPAFAVEYAAIMLRANAQHFGPIRRHEAEYVAACETLLKSVERISDQEACP